VRARKALHIARKAAWRLVSPKAIVERYGDSISRERAFIEASDELFYAHGTACSPENIEMLLEPTGINSQLPRINGRGRDAVVHKNERL
jgi:hypothetical protein